MWGNWRRSPPGQLLYVKPEGHAPTGLLCRVVYMPPNAQGKT